MAVDPADERIRRAALVVLEAVVSELGGVEEDDLRTDAVTALFTAAWGLMASMPAEQRMAWWEMIEKWCREQRKMLTH
ncbi:MAG: hypothetical protein VW405_05955 [Rhodospirillaceae bacterium]